MKVRHIKKRAKRPSFRLTRIGTTTVIELCGPQAVPRFFGPTEEESQRAAQFFAVELLEQVPIAG